MDYDKESLDDRDIIAQKENLYGFGLFGHGDFDRNFLDITGPTSEGAGNYVIETRIGYYLSSDDMEQPYGYGLIIAKFCSSGYGQWGELLSNNGYIHLTVGTFTLPGMYFFNRIAIENTLKRHGNKIIDAKPKEQVGK